MSGNNEEIDNYAAQDLEIMNTMEATKHFCFHYQHGQKRKILTQIMKARLFIY